MPTMTRPPKPAPTPLYVRLANAVHHARIAPTVSVHVQLGRGLNIWIVADVDRSIDLRIGRWKSDPSQQEWDTVLKHWPFPVSATPEHEHDSNGWNYLYATLKSPEQPKLF